jgi:Protein of unknown function (DUF3631)
METTTISQQQRPRRMRVIKLRSRRPQTGMCSLSHASVEMPASRKKPSKHVIEKLLPATHKSASPRVVRIRGNIDLQLAESLLSDVKALFKSKKELRTQSILDALAVKKPWDSICSGKRIDARRLAALLKPFGISSRDIRFKTGAFKGSAFKGYKKEWFLDAGRKSNVNSNNSAKTK